MKRIKLKTAAQIKRSELKKPRAGGGHKGKGAKQERAVAQRLSLWVSGKTRTDVFWRSAMSGGRHTGSVKRGRGERTAAHAGDLVATHHLGSEFIELFVVECKHYKKTHIDQLVFAKRGWMTAVWEKLLVECAGHREPFAVIRENFQPELVFTSATGYRWLSQGGQLPLIATYPTHGMFVLLLRDVLMLDFEKIRPIGHLRIRERMPEKKSTQPRLRLRTDL